MNRKIKKLLGLVLAILMLSVMISPVTVQAEKPYTFTTIDFPGAALTQPYGINAGGDIVGTYINPGAGQKNRGFILKGGEFTALDLPGATTDYSIVTSISPDGDIGGYYGLKGGAPTSALGFLLTKKGEWTILDNPVVPTPTMTPSPFRVLPDGTTVGCFHYSTPTGAYISMHGYIMEPDGTFERFDYPAGMSMAMHYGATPNGKTIVGVYIVSGLNHGYVLDRDSGNVITFDVPGSVITIPTDINPAGVIVGMYRNPGEAANIRHGFIAETHGSSNPADWTFTTLDVPGATITRIRGMNAGGDIVGDYVAGGVNHGFLASRTQK